MSTATIESNGIHASSRERRPSVKRLWQVPAFVGGLALVLVVWAARPAWHTSAVDRYQRDFAKFKELVAEPNAAPDAVLRLGEKLCKHSDDFPDSAGQIHFLLGSYLLAHAEKSSDYLGRALTNLEAARRHGVADTDQLPLLYRLGMARHRSGKEPPLVIECLAPSVDQAGNERSRGYEILADAYLKLPTPDVRAALAVTKKWLGLPTLNEELLTPARLLQGELLLRLGKPGEARDTLTRIGKDVPVKVRNRASYLLAQSCQEDQRWDEAATLWEEILATSMPLPESQGRILCYLGICYRELGETDKAARAWEKAVDDTGEIGQAAAFALAEVRLFGDKPAAALAFYQRALTEVPDAEHYRNSLVDLAEARRLLERGIDQYRQLGAFEQAQELSLLYEKIADTTAGQQRIADNADAWAKERLAAKDIEGARQRFHQAAIAYESLAHAASREKQPELYRQAAERFSQAADFDLALDAVKRQLELETAAERTGAAWYSLARIYLAKKDHNSALASYRKCIEYPGVSAFRARYALAAHDIDLGNFDDAEAALKQNLELLRLKPDPETHEQSLFTLAELLYRRGDYVRAAARLQEALDHYPGNRQSYKARWHLAESYRQLADQETRQLSSPQLKPDVRLHHREQYRKWLNMALANYQKLTYDLAALKTKQAALVPEDEAMLRQCDFAIGECQINLGQYADAVKLYEILAARYHHQVEHLLALRQVWRCYWILREPDKARNVVEKVRATLNEMDASAFANHPSKQTRKEWSDWIDWATKQ